MTGTNEFEARVEFGGSEIDRIIEFCNLLGRKDYGVQFVRGSFSGFTPVGHKSFSHEFDMCPQASALSSRGYRRTFEIPFIPGENISIGGKNAIRENFALEKLKLKLKVRKDGLPQDVEKEIIRLFAHHALDDAKLLRCRKGLMFSGPLPAQKEKIEAFLRDKIPSVNDTSWGKAVTELIEDIDDMTFLRSITNAYTSTYAANRFFRGCFATSLKKVFDNLGPSDSELPASILDFTFDEVGKQTGNVTEHEAMWICEAIWFLKGNIGEDLLDRLTEIVSRSRNVNIRSAALRSLCHHLQGEKDRQQDLRGKIVGLLRKEENGSELKVVALASLTSTFDKDSLPDKKTIQILRKHLKSASGSDQETIKSVSALTISQMLEHFDPTFQRPKHMNRAFKAIAAQWIHSKDSVTRRSLAQALIAFMFNGYDPLNIKFLGDQSQVTDPRKWSVGQLLEHQGSPSLENVLDLASLVVATTCERFGVVIKMGTSVSPVYRRGSKWHRLKEFMINYAQAEEAVKNSRVPRDWYRSCRGTLKGERDFQSLVASVAARERIIEAYQSSSPGHATKAIALITDVLNMIDDDRKNYSNVDSNLAYALHRCLELSQVDPFTAQARQTRLDVANKLREAANHVFASLSPNLRNIIKKKEGLRPPLKGSSDYVSPFLSPFEDPLETLAHTIFLFGLKEGANLVFVKLAAQILERRLPIIKKRLGYTPVRPVGLLSIARDIVW